jgi:hypothetical protein
VPCALKVLAHHHATEGLMINRLVAPGPPLSWLDMNPKENHSRGYLAMFGNYHLTRKNASFDLDNKIV